MSVKSRVALGLLLGLLVLLGVLVLLIASPEPVTPPPTFAYSWPIKPFNRQHPVRGAFGDPRTTSKNEPFGDTGPSVGGGYSFHAGVDIVAPPGTPVYPVVSGQVVRAARHWIRVDSSHNREFYYWHLRWHVKLGQDVVAQKTVLGLIQKPFDHVHLTEVDGVHTINPLERGRMRPYRDHTTPRAIALAIEHGGSPTLTQGGTVGRNDRLAIEAVDPPAMPVPGEFAGLPQTPALVEWRLRRGKRWGRWTVATDVRHVLPQPYDFWKVYAAGTYQNVPVFDHQLERGVPGRYLFRVALDPSTLKPGAYEIEARVADVRGNSSTTTWPIEIAPSSSG
jgi:hypothetical protein